MKNRLKALRIQHNFEIAYISNLLGISKRTYLKYENSNQKLPLYVLIEVSKLYKTSIDYIIGDTNFKIRYTNNK